MKFERFTIGVRSCNPSPSSPHNDAPTTATANVQEKLALEPTPEEAAQLTLRALLEKYKRELAEKPDSAWAWYRYGDILLALRRPAEAVPILRQAVKLAPKIALFHYDLGLALFDLEQTAAARDEFAGIVADDPELKCAWSNLMIAAMTNLALSQEKLGQRDEAIETLLPAMDTAVGILFNLGFLHFRAKRFEAALPYAHAAYVLKPNNEDVVHQYGAVLSELKRLREAVKILKQAIELNPDCEGAWHDLGLANLSLRRWKQARRCFLKALEIDPTRRWSHYDLACVDALEGKRDAAFNRLMQAAEHGFSDVKHLRQDKDLRSLRRDARWNELMEMMVRRENSKN